MYVYVYVYVCMGGRIAVWLLIPSSPHPPRECVYMYLYLYICFCIRGGGIMMWLYECHPHVLQPPLTA